MRLNLFIFPALILFIVLGAAIALAAGAPPASAVYVGAEACQPCHEEQYQSYKANSSKAKSWKSVAKMLPKLKEHELRDCYACHTTGYGRPGGFVNASSTPHLANLSCETCHGPGSAHAESGDPGEILRRPDIKTCVTCHNSERIRNFNFKPMLYHGGH